MCVCVYVCACVYVCVYAYEGVCVCVLPEDRVTDSSITFANVSSSPGISSLWTPSALCVPVHNVLYICVYICIYMYVCACVCGGMHVPILKQQLLLL